MLGGMVIGKILRSTRLVVGAAAVAVAIAVVATALDLFWIAAAALGGVQLVILVLLLTGGAADQARRLDSLSARVVGAMETERLDAADRHQELVKLLESRIDRLPD
jgi:hypothetical protein